MLSWLTYLLYPSVSSFQVAQTADGLDADLWKDGLFKSKVTRYLCFTRSFSKENVSPFAECLHDLHLCLVCSYLYDDYGCGANYNLSECLAELG